MSILYNIFIELFLVISLPTCVVEYKVL